MKIRHKITLWISSIALFAAVSLSAFIFTELLEEPFKLFDKELQHISEALFVQGQDNQQSPWHINESHLPYSPDRYWVKIFDQENTILYQSTLTQYTDIPPSGNKSRYTVEEIIPRKQIWLNQDEHDEVLFRVRVFTEKVAGRDVTMRIAKPIEELEEELLGVLREAAAGLAICTLLIIVASYTLAGRILRPVVTMNQLAREITEKSLNRRLPVGINHDELDSLATSLNHMFDRLQNSFARQKEFVGNASHELKSPITLLLLTQEELLGNKALPLVIRTDLERQLDTMRRMSTLVRNLLDLSRLEQQETLTVEFLDLEELIEYVLGEYQEMLTALNIDVTVDLTGDFVLSGDREKLVRLLINLIDNAIQYNIAENGQLNIVCRSKKDAIILDVLNTGLAIPTDDLDRLFDQFYRVEKSRSSDHGGCGLGLTIARKIVDLHGGTIRISNLKNGWIKVKVRLPREERV